MGVDKLAQHLLQLLVRALDEVDRHVLRASGSSGQGRQRLAVAGSRLLAGTWRYRSRLSAEAVHPHFRLLLGMRLARLLGSTSGGAAAASATASSGSSGLALLALRCRCRRRLAALMLSRRPIQQAPPRSSSSCGLRCRRLLPPLASNLPACGVSEVAALQQAGRQQERQT